MNCPICDTEMKTCYCSVCGFDSTSCAELYPTFFLVTAGSSILKRHTEWKHAHHIPEPPLDNCIFLDLEDQKERERLRRREQEKKEQEEKKKHEEEARRQLQRQLEKEQEKKVQEEKKKREEEARRQLQRQLEKEQEKKVLRMQELTSTASKYLIMNWILTIVLIVLFSFVGSQSMVFPWLLIPIAVGYFIFKRWELFYNKHIMPLKEETTKIIEQKKNINDSSSDIVNSIYKKEITSIHKSNNIMTIIIVIVALAFWLIFVEIFLLIFTDTFNSYTWLNICFFYLKHILLCSLLIFSSGGYIFPWLYSQKRGTYWMACFIVTTILVYALINSVFRMI